MKDTARFKEMAKTKVGDDPLVMECFLRIFLAKPGDYRITAHNLEKVRKYLEKSVGSSSVGEAGDFLVAAAIKAGEPLYRWNTVQGRVKAYQLSLNKIDTDDKKSGGDPDPIPSPVRQRDKDKQHQ